jgi:hypothetical protein
MSKWEYLAFARTGGSWSDDRFDGRTAQEKLTDLGRDGWELVSVAYDGSGYNFYLKRAITEKAKASSTKTKSAAKQAG